MKAVWSVYILLCKDQSYYTGVTIDLDRRIRAHNLGVGAKYTKGRTPVKLVWQKAGFTESEAKKEEYKIKKLSRNQKELFMKKSL